MIASTSSKSADPRVLIKEPSRTFAWFNYGDIVFYFGLFLFALWRCHSSARFLAALVGLPSFVLWFAAKRTLGTSFAFRAEARHLVSHGLYATIRHPIYLFSTVALLATAVCLHNLFFYLYVIIVVGLQVWRARAEERVLTEQFGEVYREYRDHTWF